MKVLFPDSGFPSLISEPSTHVPYVHLYNVETWRSCRTLSVRIVLSFLFTPTGSVRTGRTWEDPKRLLSNAYGGLFTRETLRSPNWVSRYQCPTWWGSRCYSGGTCSDFTPRTPFYYRSSSQGRHLTRRPKLRDLHVTGPFIYNEFFILTTKQCCV